MTECAGWCSDRVSVTVVAKFVTHHINCFLTERRRSLSNLHELQNKRTLIAYGQTSGFVPPTRHRNVCLRCNREVLTEVCRYSRLCEDFHKGSGIT
jgi:hypothetical protein